LPLLVEKCRPEDLGVDLGALEVFLRATGPLAVVDLETTGLSNDPDSEVLEFGAALLDPGSAEITTLESLICPRGELPRAVQRLTGLAPADVADAPSISDLAKPMAVALAGRVIVAHNAEFERHFLSRFVDPRLAEVRYLDTQDLLALTHPDAPDLRLETFTRDLLETEERHRALSDALDTLRVLSRAATGARSGDARYGAARNALERFAPEVPWSELLRQAPLRTERERTPQYVSIASSGEPRVPFDADAIAAVLADQERGARYFPGYRVREQQIEMARQFVRYLQDGGRLLLEGGTGVGKSLAYLAAAIPCAVERAAGGVREPIVVSTRTKLLQDQLLGKDIPAAAAMLGYPELRALSIKGRANYACARRLESTLAEGREPRIFVEDRLAYAALSACARTRPYGEIGTLPGALLFRFPALRDLRRRAVASRAEQCTREQCAHESECPFGRRRAALGDAHLVVANHDLLLRWPPDYPNVTHVIVDEAHELVTVADEVFALEVRPLEVLERFDDLFGRSSEAKTKPLLPRGKLRGVSRDVVAWRRGLQQDLVALGRALAHRASEYGEVQLPAHADRIFVDAAQLAERAAERLEAVAAHADRIAGPADAEEVDEEREAIGRSVAELLDAAQALRGAFSGGDDDAVAAFERLEAPFDRWRLVVRRVAPADLFHERFADKLESLVCVSASLFVGGDSFAALGELELEGVPGVAHVDGGADRVTVESPFAYREHMRVAALEPRGDLVVETAGVIAQLTRLLGGRTLGLFTSLRRMRDVAELLAEDLRGEGYDILLPRRATDDPAALVERFVRSGGVLLGARTFWQGLDIPGPALQAVVIEKLPFEVPTELRKRREERLKRAGENSFERYTLGKMLLNLKQMSGRLVRSEEDRGIVVIVEGRTDKRYFRRVSDALPPGCGVQVATPADLEGLLREVGIQPDA